MILNLTEHSATLEQLADGVRDVPAHMRGQLVALLTFDTKPHLIDVQVRAADLAQFALEAARAMGEKAVDAMIGGAPYLMGPLEQALDECLIRPIYSYSVPVPVEETMPDGTVKKTTIFRHASWVEAPCPRCDMALP